MVCVGTARRWRTRGEAQLLPSGIRRNGGQSRGALVPCASSCILGADRPRVVAMMCCDNVGEADYVCGGVILT